MWLRSRVAVAVAVAVLKAARCSSDLTPATEITCAVGATLKEKKKEKKRKFRYSPKREKKNY